MADKEITVFVVDLSPPMSNKTNRATTDLEYGLKYMYDIITNKILRGRKTDQISVIAVHSPNTNNPFTMPNDNGDISEFTNIEVITDQEQPLYSHLKTYSKRLTPNMEEILPTEGDLFEGIVIAVGLLKKTEKLKFRRNIVVITNGESPISSIKSDLSENLSFAVNNLNINMIMNGVDFDVGPFTYSNKSASKVRNESLLQAKFEEFNNHIYMTASQAIAAINNPPVKSVKPVKLFEGYLRFGCDILSENNDEQYDFIGDPLSISYAIEIYPATRPEKLPAGHNYEVTDELTAKIKQFREYYIEEKSSTEGSQDLKQIPVSGSEIVKGFRYSNLDLIVLDEELENASKMKTEPGMDVRGFVFKDHLPFCYLTSDANYVFPSKNSSHKDVVGFNAFVQSLIELKCYCIARFVAKPDTEVMMVVLMPVMIDSPFLTDKRPLNSKKIYSLIEIRLPFAEDEKIGRFPDITKIKTTSGKVIETDSDLLPTMENNHLMESFILSMDLDEDDSLEVKMNDNHAVMTPNFHSTSLPLPHPINKLTTVDEQLIPNSPAIYWYNTKLKRLMIDSVYSEDDIGKFMETSNPVKTEALTIDKVFNLQDVSQEKNSVKTTTSKSEDFAAQIVQDFDVHYSEKTKSKKSAEGSEDEIRAEEDDYDELPDLDVLLGVS